MYKYLSFIIFGIILYLLFNNNDKFSVGNQYIDYRVSNNQLLLIPSEELNSDIFGINPNQREINTKKYILRYIKFILDNFNNMDNNTIDALKLYINFIVDRLYRLFLQYGEFNTWTIETIQIAFDATPDFTEGYNLRLQLMRYLNELARSSTCSSIISEGIPPTD